jgi:hypothetical protein
MQIFQQKKLVHCKFGDKNLVGGVVGKVGLVGLVGPQLYVKITSGIDRISKKTKRYEERSEPQ